MRTRTRTRLAAWLGPACRDSCAGHEEVLTEYGRGQATLQSPDTLDYHQFTISVRQGEHRLATIMLVSGGGHLAGLDSSDGWVGGRMTVVVAVAG